MTLNACARRGFLQPLLLLALAAGLLAYPAAAQARGAATALPPFADFARSIPRAAEGVPGGVYVPGVLALPIVQQPAGDSAYISTRAQDVTLFGMAARQGIVGLLAHNYLAGSAFAQLKPGQEVRLVSGDGSVEYFTVAQILQFQALQPESPYSTFRDLANNEMLTAEQLFNRVYGGDRHVTFQTCIAGDESLSWGRLFVIALPAERTRPVDRLDVALAP